MKPNRSMNRLAILSLLLLGLSVTEKTRAQVSLLHTTAQTIPMAQKPGRIALRPTGGFALVIPGKQEIHLLKPDTTASNTLVLEKTFAIGGRPIAIAVMNNGNILVGDDKNKEVAIYSPQGEKIGFFGQGYGEVEKPADLEIDRSALLVYVVDSVKNHIRVFNWDGRPIRTIGSTGNGDGQFDCPVSIGIKPATGDIFVADFKNMRVQAFNRAGVFFGKVGSGITGSGWSGPKNSPGDIFRPAGVNVDGLGRLLVSDSRLGWVQAFETKPTAFGAYLGLSAVIGPNPGELINPIDVAVDTNNRLLVAAAGSLEVEVYNSLATSAYSLPTTPVPTTRTAMVTYPEMVFDTKSIATTALFQVEIWGASVHHVDLASIKLNGSVPAVNLTQVKGQRPGIFHIQFRYGQLGELVKNAKGDLQAIIAGSLAGGGKFSGTTTVLRKAGKKRLRHRQR